MRADLFDPEPESDADLEGARDAAQGDNEDRDIMTAEELLLLAIFGAPASDSEAGTL